MDKGFNNHNWFSLSIDEYIKECQTAIDTFNETKNIVLQHAHNIEKKVVKIEGAQIIRAIDFDRKSPMNISEFAEYFESHRVKTLGELVKDYTNIGEQYLKSIEECTVKNNADATKASASEEMRPYYMYWERRIFNAITKMIARALAANKTIYMRTERPNLIKMTSSYNHPEISYHPPIDELKTQLEKFSRNILESTKSFGRWWDGYCKIFESTTHEETGEKYIPYTFFDDVMQNKMITQLNYEIIQCGQQIIQKFKLFTGGQKKIARLFDKNEMTKLQKQIEKSQSTQLIEGHILYNKQLKEFNMMSDNKQYNYLVLVDNSEVKESIIQKIDEWLMILGDSLKAIATKELKAIIAETQNYNKGLNGEMAPIENLKTLLNVIAEIKNISMDMEFRIVEVQEQFRVLKMYNYEIEEAT
jgi:dynein heavy chain